jgi:hypothetical protein
MLADMTFDICLMCGLFSGWDARWLMVTHGFAVVAWVLALSGELNKATIMTILIMVVTTMIYRIMPEIQMSGTGWAFWNIMSVGIYEMCQISIFVLVASMAVRSTLLAKLRGYHIDILSNPKKRFLLPIGAWAVILPLFSALVAYLPMTVYENRYVIASHVLVWGWVVLELPYYVLRKRLRVKYA